MKGPEAIIRMMEKELEKLREENRDLKRLVAALKQANETFKRNEDRTLKRAERIGRKR